MASSTASSSNIAASGILLITATQNMESCILLAQLVIARAIWQLCQQLTVYLFALHL